MQLSSKALRYCADESGQRTKPKRGSRRCGAARDVYGVAGEHAAEAPLFGHARVRSLPLAVNQEQAPVGAPGAGCGAPVIVMPAVMGMAGPHGARQEVLVSVRKCHSHLGYG